jgi:hypothetical protein
VALDNNMLKEKGARLPIWYLVMKLLDSISL